MNNSSPHSLQPAGFLIVEDARAVQARSGVNYHGVDRRPPLYAPDDSIRIRLGEPFVTDPRLHSALDQYFDAICNPTPFIGDYEAATSLFESLCSFDYALELLYCEVAWTTEEEETPRRYPVSLLPGRSSLTYGFDVSWPSANHSAIFQPGVVPGNPKWLQKLNEWGLLNDYDDAVLLREEYLAVYPNPPFEVFLVHRATADEASP